MQESHLPQINFSKKGCILTFVSKIYSLHQQNIVGQYEGFWNHPFFRYLVDNILFSHAYFEFPILGTDSVGHESQHARPDLIISRRQFWHCHLQEGRCKPQAGTRPADRGLARQSDRDLRTHLVSQKRIKLSVFTSYRVLNDKLYTRNAEEATMRLSACCCASASALQVAVVEAQRAATARRWFAGQ